MARIIGRGLDALRDFIRKCIEAGGVPIFRTRYGGRRFPNNAVVAACWGAGDKVRGGMITDIPPDIIQRMEETKGDWKWLAEELGIPIYT